MKLIGSILLLIVLLYLSQTDYFNRAGKVSIYSLVVFLIILSYLEIKKKPLIQLDNFKQTGKLAFCFLIYDDINQDDLWFDFFKNIDKNKYNIYIHYKANKTLKYFEQYKLNNCIDTKWGDVSLARAHLLIYEKALEDSQNKKFIVLSNSCIPVKNFNYIYNLLMNDNDKSYFNEARLPSSIYNQLKSNYKKSEVKKASQWFIINRELTETIVSHKDDTVYFENVHAPDEIFFLTTILKYKPEKQSNIEILDNLPFATTFTNWYTMDYNYPKKGNSGASGPWNYGNISEDELLYILTSNSLFSRKFNKNCKVKLNSKGEIDLQVYIKQKIF